MPARKKPTSARAKPRAGARAKASGPKRRTSVAAGPLAGITVVDLTRILSGPYCTMMLCDLGARVIKVERPGSGDDARAIGPFTAAGSAYFASVNRGKESVALDLKHAADRASFERLVDARRRAGRKFPAGHDGEARLRLEARAQALAEARLRERLRLRRHGPASHAAGVRHRRAGDGRNHEHHGRAGREADARRQLDRRHRRGHVRGDRHDRRAAPAPRDRARRARRRRDARCAGRAARECHRALRDERPGAGAASARATRRSRRSARSRRSTARS